MCPPSGIASFERTLNSSSSRLFRRRTVDCICSAQRARLGKRKSRRLLKTTAQVLGSKLKTLSIESSSCCEAASSCLPETLLRSYLEAELSRPLQVRTLDD